MTITLPEIQVGEASRFKSLSIFPLFLQSTGAVDYLLSDEALVTNLVRVEEISEQGSVPELLVKNESDARILFLEGEELIGAKQNRILNTSVLVGAKSTVRIPVSCVERGRWRFSSRHFSSAKRHSPAKLRSALKASVSKSIHEKKGFVSDQMGIWNQVEKYGVAYDVHSPTGAMAHTFDAVEKELGAARKSLAYTSGASGLAIAIGRDVVCLELFDKPATCEKVWDRLVSGYLLDVLRDGEPGESAGERDVAQVIGATKAAQWAHVPAVGEGDEFRAEFGKDHASALCLGSQLVHGSVVGA